MFFLMGQKPMDSRHRSAMTFTVNNYNERSTLDFQNLIVAREHICSRKILMYLVQGYMECKKLSSQVHPLTLTKPK